jgi:hypothetical protein
MPTLFSRGGVNITGCTRGSQKFHLKYLKVNYADNLVSDNTHYIRQKLNSVNLSHWNAKNDHLAAVGNTYLVSLNPGAIRFIFHS